MSGPWRRDFDAARDPYTARNALGILPTPAGAPTNAEYITASANATLTNERVLTNTPTITWDFSTAGQAKASAAGGGNVSNSGTPTAGQYGKWVTATTIQGVAPATVLSDIGAQPAGSYQPLDADLTAIAALAGINTIYYRSAANTWSPVVVSTGLAFSGGNLTATGAPVGAEYITSTADATLTAERVLTDTATVTWDRTTAGQIKANAAAAGGGAITSVVVQKFTASGTYTPTSGMKYCIVEAIGGGGAGGGCQPTAVGVFAGSGGGSGGYSRRTLTAAAVGASQTITVGAGGTSPGYAAGNAGGDTSLGTLVIAKGGLGGRPSGAEVGPPGGDGAPATGTGDIVCGGTPGQPGFQSTVAAYTTGGAGAGGPFGGGGQVAFNPTITGNQSQAGLPGKGFGSGGGAGVGNGTGSVGGGAGAPGLVIITEYV